MRRRRLVGVLAALVLAGCTGTPAALPVVRSSSSTVLAPPQIPAAATSPEDVLAGRAVHTATALADGTLLVAGGCDVDGCTTATASAMLVGNGVRPAADLIQARDSHTAVLLADGSVLAVGGFTAEQTPALRSAERYLPAENRWVTTGSLASGRGGHAMAMFGDGRVLVAGGWGPGGRPTAATEIYDPGTGVFTAGPELPSAVDALGAASLPDGSVLVAGGRMTGDVASSFAVQVSADGRTALPVGSLATGRFKHEMVALPSGEVLVLGGTVDDRELLASTEIYQPASRTFRPGPTMSQGRYKIAGGVAVLPDGRVLVGSGGTGVELLDVDGSPSVPVLAGVPTVRTMSATVDVVGAEVVGIGGYDGRIGLTRNDWRIRLADLPS